MKISPNIGILNALIRITVGFTVISWGTAKLVKRPWRDSYLWMIMLGAMKIAEGIVRFCPMTALFERGQDMMNERNHSSNSNHENKYSNKQNGNDKKSSDIPEIKDLAGLEQILKNK